MKKIYQNKLFNGSSATKPSASPACRWLIVTILFLGLSACQTNISPAAWPEGIPSRHYFELSAKAKLAPEDPKFESKVGAYLVWIKRFYTGSIIYPLGWLEMTHLLLDSIEEPDERQEAADRLYELGRTIATEWAQDNSVSKIKSANIAAWGSALRTAADNNQQLEFIGKVEDDVAALLSGRLKSDAISRERYYPPEDYDNF